MAIEWICYLDSDDHFHLIRYRDAMRMHIEGALEMSRRAIAMQKDKHYELLRMLDVLYGYDEDVPLGDAIDARGGFE